MAFFMAICFYLAYLGYVMESVKYIALALFVYWISSFIYGVINSIKR